VALAGLLALLSLQKQPRVDHDLRS